MTAADSIAQVSTIATHAAFTVWGVTSAILSILVLMGIFFFIAWYVGRGPFVALLLSFYGSYAVYVAFPFMSYVPTAPALTALGAHIGLYAAFTLLFYIILRRVVVSDFLYIGVFGLIALSFLGAAFLLAFAYHIFSVTAIYSFTPAVASLFAPNQYFFWWFVAPVIGLFFLAR